MKTYVTFGQIHTHSINGQIFDKDCVAVIHARTPQAGRNKAFEIFSTRFSFEYSEDEFNMDWMKHYPRGFIEVN